MACRVEGLDADAAEGTQRRLLRYLTETDGAVDAELVATARHADVHDLVQANAAVLLIGETVVESRDGHGSLEIDTRV